jgi:hypothetical protein
MSSREFSGRGIGWLALHLDANKQLSPKLRKEAESLQRKLGKLMMLMDSDWRPCLGYPRNRAPEAILESWFVCDVLQRGTRCDPLVHVGGSDRSLRSCKASGWPVMDLWDPTR